MRTFRDAHGVNYIARPSERELAPADAADKAIAFTVKVICYR